MGEQAAAQPFQMPVAPVAGFTPFQQQYFNEIQGMQGMSQPYFNLGQQYLQGSAAPISGQDVANYYNPMAQNVFANLQNVFGQQMQQTTGNLTQQAGGVGADRIAVGQADLAKQQGLAAGQTAAGLYQQALQAAEQQKQMMAGAGYGIAQMGPAAQSAMLQGIGALGGAGAQQQQLTQAQLNALYQNQLAGIAYPFQTAQYLAGITGGLAPAMGGTTAGYGTTTAPAPTLGAQLLGVGTGALGLAGAGNQAGLWGSGSGKGSYSPTSAYQTSLGWYPSNAPYNTARGGGIPNPMAEGGEVIPFPMQGSPNDFLIWNEDVDRAVQKHLARRNPEAQATRATISRVLGGTGNVIPFHPQDPGPHGSGGTLTPFLQSGGAADTDQQDSIPPIPGVALPKAGGLSPIPFTSLPMGGGHSGLFQGEGIQMQQPQSQQQSGSGLGQALGMAMKFLPLAFAARGGAVNPFDVGQPFQDAGAVSDDDSLPPTTDVLPQARPLGAPGEFGNVLDRAGAGVKTIETGSPMGDYQNITTTTNPRTGKRQSALGAYQVMEDELPQWTSQVFGQPISKQEFLYGPHAKEIQDTLFRQKFGESSQKWGQGDTARGIELAGREWFGGPGGVRNTGATDAFGRLTTGGYGRQVLAAANPQPGEEITGGPMGEVEIPGARYAAYQNPMAAPNADMSALPPQGRHPYPDITPETMDVGQKMARSPWMALVAAGAQMAQTRGPIGSVIGAGMGAGAKELEGQRKELRSEADINRKADELAQQWKVHLDAYQRAKPMTEYERIEAAKPVIAGQSIDALGRTHNIYVQRMPDGSYKQIEVPGLGGTAPAGGADELSGKTGDEWLNAALKSGVINQGQANKIKQIASGDQDLSKVASYREKGAMADLVSQYDPSFNTYNAPLRAQTAKNYTGTGVEARNFTSNDMAIKHIASGLGNIEAMGNLTYAPALNVPYNIWRRETSPKFQEAQSGLKTDVDAIGSELMRSFRGSGSASEREATEWRSNFPINGSPVEMRRAFQEAANLLAGRITAAGNRYNDAMGPLHARDPLSWLSKEGRNIIEYTTNKLDPQKPIPSNWKDIVAGKAATAPAGHEGIRPSPEERFNQLRESGLDKAAAYAKMHQEGY